MTRRATTAWLISSKLKPIQQPRLELPGQEKATLGSPYSATERRVPELITVLGSQPAGDVSHKPDVTFRQAWS